MFEAILFVKGISAFQFLFNRMKSTNNYLEIYDTMGKAKYK